MSDGRRETRDVSNQTQITPNERHKRVGSVLELSRDFSSHDSDVSNDASAACRLPRRLSMLSVRASTTSYIMTASGQDRQASPSVALSRIT